MKYVYTVIHDGQGNFMIAYKNPRGYFFHNPAGAGGSVIPNGQPLHGGGNFALPGGGLDGDPVAGAIKEFKEETGLDLGDYAPHSIFSGPNDGFFGVYFNLGVDYQQSLDIIQANIEKGIEAANAVKQGAYSKEQYDELLAAFPGCPADNELGKIYSWNLKTNIAQINALAGSRDTDWFFAILSGLALETYGVIVTDPDKSLGGIGSDVDIIEGPQYLINNFTEDPGILLQSGNYTIFYGRATFPDVCFVDVNDEIGIFGDN